MKKFLYKDGKKKKDVHEHSLWSPQYEILFSGFRSCEQAVCDERLESAEPVNFDSVIIYRWLCDPCKNLTSWYIYFCYKCAERKVVSCGISSNSAEYVFYLLFRAYNLPVKQIFKILPLKNKWLELSNVIFINNLIFFYYRCEISPMPYWQICMTHAHFLLQVFLKEFVCACMCMRACMCVNVCVCFCVSDCCVCILTLWAHEHVCDYVSVGACGCSYRQKSASGPFPVRPTCPEAGAFSKPRTHILEKLGANRPQWFACLHVYKIRTSDSCRELHGGLLHGC